MTTYRLVSRLDEVRALRSKASFTTRVFAWLKKNASPAAPDKPLCEMTEAEHDRVPPI